MDQLPELITSEELAAYLGVPLATLFRWRTAGTAPRGIRYGRRVMYRPGDIETWLESRSEAVAS
jgi:predicted DNA-binding transcriptional regulator AlpA